MKNVANIYEITAHHPKLLLRPFFPQIFFIKKIKLYQ